MKKVIILLIFVPLVFFGQNNTKSELIKKINAVQQQVMAQGNISELEEKAILSLCSILTKNDGLENYNSDDRMILKDVEMPPIYYGCEDLSIKEIRKCFNNKISAFIKREFNPNVIKYLKLLKPKEVDAFFIIDEKGNRTGMKVRNSELTVQAEILRVLRKIPIMKPAFHDGKSVSVLCSIRVKYGNEVEVDVVHIPERPNDK
jgi:hypothetical protein